MKLRQSQRVSCLRVIVPPHEDTEVKVFRLADRHVETQKQKAIYAMCLVIAKCNLFDGDLLGVYTNLLNLLIGL